MTLARSHQVRLNGSSPDIIEMKFDYLTDGSDLLTNLSAFATSESTSAGVGEVVSEIISSVKKDGDVALLERTKLYDHADLKPADLRICNRVLEQSIESLSENEINALREAIDNVRSFHLKSFPENWSDRNSHGAEVGERYYPIQRVGLYVPGGNVPLVSTVIMTATLAKVAKVPEIVVVTPPNADGVVAPQLLSALRLLDISEVYSVGGAQAIAALAHGTESIPAVDKIFGPGNAYVNEAKRQVFGTVGVDLLPGPSEIMVLADETANPQLVAAALLAQAEHGSGKEKVYFLFNDSSLFPRVIQEIERQLPSLSHKTAIEEVLTKGFRAILIEDKVRMAEVATFVAPEHLELQVADDKIDFFTERITTAGALLLGHLTATSLGDFVAGPSHVLPTGRSSRFSSGLRLQDFLRRTSFIKYDETSIRAAHSAISRFSEMEKLDAHGKSLDMRVNLSDS